MTCTWCAFSEVILICIIVGVVFYLSDSFYVAVIGTDGTMSWLSWLKRSGERSKKVEGDVSGIEN